MTKFKIQTKIMSWYLILSGLLLGILIPVIYATVAGSLEQTFHEKIESAIAEVVSTLGSNSHTFFIDKDDLDIEGDIRLLAMDQSGDLLYKNNNADWLKNTAIGTNEATITHAGTEWLVLKRSYTTNDQKVTVIAASATHYMMEPLHDLELSFLAIIPVYLLLSAWGALFIAKRALKPVATITATAQAIGKGDLTRRIENIGADDEIGALAATLNRMLDDVEISFQRERQFTSDASHELRMPVTVIDACCQDTLRYDLGDEIQENFTAIQAETARMAHIIAQLLMISRGYEGRIHMEPDQIGLAAMVQMIIEEIAELPETAEKQITIVNEIPEGLLITGDQSLLTQLFVNLLENAVKYGLPRGHIRIFGNDDGKNICIGVYDDGIGIAGEDLPHIFERFYRADRARDRSGSGLGLAIAKWIVELHGGSITARCDHEGTTFEILLPKTRGF